MCGIVDIFVLAFSSMVENARALLPRALQDRGLFMEIGASTVRAVTSCVSFFLRSVLSSCSAEEACKAQICHDACATHGLACLHSL